MTTTRVKKKRKRRQRRQKLHYLRHRLAETSDLRKRRQLLAKMKRISPRTPIPDD